jgi:hypothetical protein
MMSSEKTSRLTALVLCLGLVLGLSLLLGGQPRETPRPSLPIYRLSPHRCTLARLQELARRTVRAEGASGAASSNRLRLRSGGKVVEIHKASGGCWAADHDHLWNWEARPKLPGRTEAIKIAHECLQASQCLPEPGVSHPARVALASLPSTRMVKFDVKSRKRSPVIVLDQQVNFTTTLQVAGPGGAVQTLPVVGGGGEFNITLGHKGQVIAFSGVWRPIDRVEKWVSVIPRARADELYLKQMAQPGLKVVIQTVTLAYYSAPATQEQHFLYPVYAYTGVAERDGKSFSLRTVLLPATEFVPPVTASAVVPPPQPERTDKDLPLASSRISEAQKDPLKLRTAACSWQEGDKAAANAAGFLQGLKKDGWTINFDWGGRNAWVSDWADKADKWVDAADLVFYTGTANAGAGWYLWDRGAGASTTLTSARVTTIPGPVGPLWGQRNLEWIVIGACGPLQDNELEMFDGDAIARWKDTFHGLHQILGYASQTVATTEEGRLFTQYCCEDEETTIQAWFRTAKEVQPSHIPGGGPQVYAAAMYAGCHGKASPAHDHLWGHGFVADDPVVPEYFVVIWTPT